jgi:D-alanyl-D-alanine endopeptidase (penicillin-binding protein 7)
MRILVATFCLLLVVGSAPAASAPATGRDAAPTKSTRTSTTTSQRSAAAKPRATGSKPGAATGGKAPQAAPTAAARTPSKSTAATRAGSAGKPAAAKKGSARPAVPVSRPRTTTGGERLRLASGAALVVDQARDQVIYDKNSDVRLPIASVTKLMTAMVVLDARLPLFEEVQVNDQDVDWLKGSRSRLPLGTSITRHELLYLALVASENRAASALARSHPGGKPAFVAAMNRKAEALGMADTHFEDPTGLFPSNTSTARDLLRMLRAAYGYPMIRQITTTPFYTLTLPQHAGNLDYRNTNRLIRAQNWDIGISKTGYIHEAGRCLVMQADLADRPLLIVLLNGEGRGTPFEDVARLRDWLARQAPAAEATLAHTAG